MELRVNILAKNTSTKVSQLVGFLGLVLLFSHTVFGQVTIFTENMGSPAGTTAIASNTFQNSTGALTYSGTADIRNSSVSTGYTGATGGGNVFITNTIGRTFEIANISTLGYATLTLQFGAIKSTTASNMSELVLEYSTDGTSYSAVSFPGQPTGTGTATWRLISSISLPSAACNITNLRLRWRQTSATPSFRIDDVKLSGTLPTYTITYNGNTNTSGSAPTDATSPYAAGATVTTLGNTGNLTKTGYSFNDWNTAANGTGTSQAAASTFTMPSSNVVLYAQWSPNNYTVTFDANTGTGSMSSQAIAFTASANLTANSFTKSGYTFSGWNTAANGSGIAYADQASYTMGAANATLYAQWAANNNTLTFDGNGATSGSTSPQTIPSNATVALNSNGFVNTGNNFAGWSTSAGGSVVYTDGASYTIGTSNETLYAVWTPASTPTISASGSLSAVHTTYGSASASPASFSVSGSTLSNDITLTAPSGYELSSGAGYANSLTLTQSGGNVSSTTIYVRLSATTPVGTYAGNIAITSSGASTVLVATISSTVSAVVLTISGITGSSKEYDGTTTATFSGSPAYNGLVNGETYTVQGAASATFNTSSVGTNKPITVSGFTAPSSNYTLTQPSLSADITAKPLTVTGASAANKAYDGNTIATISGGSLVGVVSPDVVTLNQAGSFVSANVGTGISITPNFTLGGASAGNYTLTQPTGLSADITLASQAITFGALANQFVGNADYSPGATANSGLSVSYTSSNTSVATIVNGMIHIVAAGTTTITATQAGNSNYAAATSVNQSLTVTNPPLAAWDFTGENTLATSSADIYNSNLDASSSITRGAGATASSGANSFRTTGFQNNGISTSSNDYFQTTLSAIDGYTLSISSINARFAGTGSFYASPGVTSQFAYSLDGTNFTLIGSPLQHTSLAPPAFDLSGVSALQNVAPGTTVTFRYYASGQTTTGGWGFNSSASGVYGLSFNGIVSAIPSALPVELVSFAAACVDENVTVNWTTASEHNSLNFTVQGSEEGTTWNDIQTISAAGNSTTTIDYSIADRSSIEGTHYYRLIQTDQDGVQKIYGPIQTNCASEEIGFITYPNPSTGDFTLQFNAKNIYGDVVMNVADASGKIVRSVQFTIEHGTQSVFIPSLDLCPGIYHIQLLGNHFQTGVFKHSLR
jgi:uncharacterized repeat protein (TIGR02543 family)